MRTLRKILLGLCWFTLFAAFLAAVGTVLFHAHIDNEVKKFVLAELEKRYPDLLIQVGNAQILENRGISVKDIEFAVPHPSGNPRKLLHVGELFIETPVNLHVLYQKKPQINRVTVKNPILRATRHGDGTFRELQVFFTGGVTPPALLPPIDVENAVLLYDDAARSPQPLRFTGINLNVVPENSGKSLQIKGSADGDLFRRLTFEGAFQPETKQWQLTAQCRQFDWTDDLRQYISGQWSVNSGQPQAASRYISKNNYQLSIINYPLFHGRFDFNLQAASDAGAEFGCRFAVNGTLSHGRLDIPHLKRTLTELSTRFEITNDKIVIDKLTGSGDSCRFAMSYTQEGLRVRRRGELTANLRDFPLDEKIAEMLSPVLPKSLQNLLAKFDYGGTADIHGNLVCSGGKWTAKNVSMQVSDIGFAYKDLPYRMDRLTGNLYIDEKADLHFNFVTKSEEPVKAVIEGHYQNIFIDPAGSVTVTGEHVPIDRKLIQALPPVVQGVAASLQPSGKLHARLVFTLPPGDVPLQKHFGVVLDNVNVCYDKFPYPLREVTGTLQSDGTVWQFENVAGRNGTAIFKGEGYLRAQEFALTFSAQELPVDDQVEKALLNPEQRQLLQGLNVSGKVNLNARALFRIDNKRLDLSFQATPLPGLSMMPDRFPYKVENVGGTICYENGHVFAETLTGTHRETQFRGGFDCRFEENGQSVLRLTPLAVDQVLSNRELWDALPKNLQGFMESLQITKPYNVSGGIEIRRFPNGEQTAAWDLNCVLHQNSAKIGLPVDNIFGTIRLTGHSVPQQFRLNGELNLDSLTVRIAQANLQTTSVRGPFYFDGTRIQLGLPANKLTPHIPARPLTGKFCDGTIAAEGLVLLNNGLSYSINTALLGANLAKIAREIEPAAKKTSGTLNCVNVNLQGSGMKWETLGGTGQIQLRDANIVEAPAMMRMLRELRIKESDPNAGMFTSADINFKLAGLQMFFDPIIFEGGALSLFGSGVMRLDNRQMDLTMKTRLGNRRNQIPIVSSIIGGVGDQIVQLQITGSTSDPVVKRVVLPEIQKGLQSPNGEPAATRSEPPK